MLFRDDRIRLMFEIGPTSVGFSIETSSILFASRFAPAKSARELPPQRKCPSNHLEVKSRFIMLCLVK
jgi:hypothetical protein